MINVRVFNYNAYINDPVDPGAITLLGVVTLGLLIFNNAIICDNYYNASSTKWWL